MERHVQQWLGIGLHFLNPRRREKLNYMNDRNVAYGEATKNRIEVNAGHHVFKSQASDESLAKNDDLEPRERFVLFSPTNRL